MELSPLDTLSSRACFTYPTLMKRSFGRFDRNMPGSKFAGFTRLPAHCEGNCIFYLCRMHVSKSFASNFVAGMANTFFHVAFHFSRQTVPWPILSFVFLFFFFFFFFCLRQWKRWKHEATRGKWNSLYTDALSTNLHLTRSQQAFVWKTGTGLKIYLHETYEALNKKDFILRFLIYVQN